MAAQSELYRDIATRTGGDIYIGVVGPVRTGKSTLIKRFMETMVLPRIESEPRRSRAADELPQSAAGRTIMTTEPKFIPEEAVSITLEGNISLRVRMIDCVGYIVPSALGYIENQQPRMVMTPWYDKEVPFSMAAEVGTRKVINEHSTIGLVVTTDGSISEIPRAEYEEAEARVVRELQAINKPFVVVLNCQSPKSPAAKALRAELEERYGVPVAAVNCLELDEEDIAAILGKVLVRFPLKEAALEIPAWVMNLAADHWLKEALYRQIRQVAGELGAVGSAGATLQKLEDCDYVKESRVLAADLGSGTVRCRVELAGIKKKYEKFAGALDEVAATGYGIVMPTMEELHLEEPEIMKQGGRYGIRLRASAPSIHLMQANITTEVAPIVGSERQSEELVHYLLQEFEENPAKIWESNIFGKSLHELVNEGLHNKLYRMPADARMKLQETIERVINEGCSGLICIIL